MFLEPVFLGGLAAISVPIIVHLMHSPQAKLVHFSTLRFLKACKKRAVRRSRLRNILLMLIRIALVALIALAMARPWRQNVDTSLQPNTPMTAVLVLDNSYSMGYLEKGRSRFDLAREAAIRLVDGLKPGDDVAIVLMNERAEPFIRDFTTDLERIKKALREAELSPAGTNADPALREAVRLARKAGAGDPRIRRRVEVILLTDMQASAWETILKSDYLKSLPRDLRLFLVNFGRPDSVNGFIQSIAVTASGSDESTITAEVHAVGTGQTDQIITLGIDGTNVDQEPFPLSAGQPSFVSVQAPFRQPGTYRGTLTLQEDNLPIDDRFHFTVDVGDKTSVLIVDGDPVSIPSLCESYYLVAALNPGKFLPTGVSAVETHVVTAAEFPSTKLDGHRSIILCNVEKLDGADLIRIENFLREGSGLLIFLGDRIQPEHYNDWSFLPIRLTQPYGDSSKKVPFSMGMPPAEHRLYSDKLDLRSARFFLCFDSDPPSLKKDAAVLSRYSHGKPAIVEGRLGKGKVILFTSSADLSWSNFALRRSFLPWLFQAVAYISNQESQGKAYALHDPVTFQALASAYKQSITVTDPAGKQVVLHPQVKGAYAEAVYTETRLPGIYRVSADAGFSHSGGFGVNVARKESVLTLVPPSQVIAAAPEGMVTYFDATKGDVAQELHRAHQGEKLWPFLFQLALLIFVIESIVANFMSRERKTSGIKIPLFDMLRRRTPGVEAV